MSTANEVWDETRVSCVDMLDAFAGSSTTGTYSFCQLRLDKHNCSVNQKDEYACESFREGYRLYATPQKQ